MSVQTCIHTKLKKSKNSKHTHKKQMFIITHNCTIGPIVHVSYVCNTKYTSNIYLSSSQSYPISDITQKKLRIIIAIYQSTQDKQKCKQTKIAFSKHNQNIKI